MLFLNIKLPSGAVGLRASPAQEFRRLMLEDEWVASKLRSACEQQLKQESFKVARAFFVLGCGAL